MHFQLRLKDGTLIECKRLPTVERSSTMTAETYGVKVQDRGEGTFEIYPWDEIASFRLVRK